MASITAHVAVLLLLALAGMVEAQLNCAEAPTEALQIQCEQIQKWDTSIREAAEKQANAPKLPPGFDTGSLVGSGMGLDIVPTNLQHCVDLSCACNYLQGTLSGDTCNLASGGVFKKIVRKEYRVMTDEERGRFHGVLNALQATQDFKDLQKIHSQTGSSGSAHSGPAFLPWHREYIKRLEFIIRRQDPTLFLPYWDSTLDTALPKPADSIMFTDNFLGTTDADGNIVTGPFAEWRTLNTNKQVRRKVGAQGAPFTNENIQSVLQQTAIEQVLAFTAPQAGCSFKPNWNVLEYTHGNVHIFIGGDMLDQSTSSNDPAFFLHHCFVDLIWELWRQAAQNRDQRETDYPADNQACSGTQHFKNAIMKPFAPMQNDDGLLNSYTDQLYEYAPRPTCPDCGGSAYLFCDTSHGAPRCGAKAKIGGACNGFTNGEDVCYGGVCDGSVCAPAPEPTPPPTTPPPIIITTPPPAVTEDCFNEAPCCSYWAGTGECSKNKAYMEQWCKVSCGACTPKAYDPNAECNDRHINCATWSASGECDKNPSWMGENCRQSCKLCGKTRAEQCTPGQAVTEAPVEHCDSPGCYNEFECCSTWADEGECRSNATFMSCNCRVSCGICSPTDYKYGGCNDFHKDCPAWAAGGQCQLNPWMLENCRASCRNCQDQRTLRSRCSRTRSSGRGGSRNGAFGGFGGFGGRRGFHGGGGFGGGGWGWG